MMDISGSYEEHETGFMPGDLASYDETLSKSQHTSKSCTWLKPEDKTKLIAEIESLQKVCQKLSQNLEKNEEEARKSRESQICSEERVRQQEKLLEDARQIVHTTLKENSELLMQLDDLQRWTDCFDDEEAGQAMRKIYEDLQTWIQQNFGCESSDDGASQRSSEGSLMGVMSQSPDSVYEDIISDIHREVSGHIFSSILTRFMIGFSADFGQYLYYLGKQVHETCPPHIWQHWRSATSSASASLENEKIDADCERIIQIVENRFGHYSRTDFKTRTQGLKALLWQSIEFKKRLECQCDFYLFWRSSLNRPFRSEHMISPTLDDPSDEVVESSVWPMLFRGPAQEAVVVQKELVRTMPKYAHISPNETCSSDEADDEVIEASSQ